MDSRPETRTYDSTYSRDMERPIIARQYHATESVPQSSHDSLVIWSQARVVRAVGIGSHNIVAVRVVDLPLLLRAAILAALALHQSVGVPVVRQSNVTVVDIAGNSAAVDRHLGVASVAQPDA